jgi:hypothetical protein
MITSHPINNARNCAAEKAWLNEIYLKPVTDEQFTFTVVSLNGKRLVIIQ